MRTAVFLALLFTASVAQATSYFPEQELETHEKIKTDPETLSHHRGTPQEDASAIPKDWELVSVSGGDKQGSFTLWFQADDGSVYLKQGELLHDRLVLHDLVIKIPAK